MGDDLDILKRNQQEFLLRLSDLAEVKLSALAKDRGIAHTTLTRFVNSVEVPETALNTATLFLVTQAAIIRLNKLLGDCPTTDLKRRFALKIQSFIEWAEKKGFAIRADLAPLLEPFVAENENLNLRRVSVIAHIEAGDWREAIEWDVDKHYTIQTPELGFDGLTRRGFEVRGESMNLIYPAGTVLVCVPIIKLQRDLKNGERVIVQRHRNDGTIEATCKEYQLGQDGVVWLWPRSSDPMHQTPITPQNPGPGIDLVEITGLVIFSVRREASE